MSVLSAAQSAGIRLLGVKPNSLFSTSDPFALELADLATEVAVDIMKGHEWEQLKFLATLNGDGSKMAFDFPNDYDRMIKKGDLHSKNWRTAKFTRARDEDEWIFLQDNNITGTPGYWIVLGGKVQIFPPMPVGETARFYYISKSIIQGTDPKSFTKDTDVFLLPERLLTLGLMWRWRSQKRMEYSEDMANFEKALSEEIAADKPSRILTVGRQRIPSDVSIAYPGSILP